MYLIVISIFMHLKMCFMIFSSSLCVCVCTTMIIYMNFICYISVKEQLSSCFLYADENKDYLIFLILTCPNHFSFLFLTIFSKLSLSQIHPSIIRRISEFVTRIFGVLRKFKFTHVTNSENRSKLKVEFEKFVAPILCSWCLSMFMLGFPNRLCRKSLTTCTTTLWWSPSTLTSTRPGVVSSYHATTRRN